MTICCNTKCSAIARWNVLWPGKTETMPMCDYHKGKAEQILDIMGYGKLTAERINENQKS